MKVRLSATDIYIGIVFLAGLGGCALAFLFNPVESPWGLLAVAGLSAVSERMAVRLYSEGWVSISFVGTILAAVVFGPSGAVVVASANTFSGYLFTDRSRRKLVFNFGQMNLAALAACLPQVVGLIPDHSRSPLWLTASGGLGGAANFIVSACAVSMVMSLTGTRTFASNYRENFAWLLPHHVGLGLVAGALGIFYLHLGIPGILVFAVPLILSRHSQKQVLDKTRDNVLRLERSNEQLQRAYVDIRDMSTRLEEAYSGTLESLVAALDMRDQETGGHSHRVALHSLEIARMLGIADEEELAMVYRGALMHDVGKIGVPDAILRKPDKLTDEEWEYMRRHPAMGYRILAQVPYLRPAARIVLAHHERWDGAGYPRRLKGENIPLGARIFALSDAYDAIISDRPYRKGQTPEAAKAEILRCAGEQFDPKVVEAFEALFPQWRTEKVGRRAAIYLPARSHAGPRKGKAAS
jgi:hypothetical protein